MPNKANHQPLSTTHPQALLYLRAASGHQADRDRVIVAQQHVCTQRAEELGAVVIAEFVDFGSGLSLERPGLTDLLAKVAELRTTEPGRQLYVIAADHARIGRSVEAYSRVSYEIERAGAWLNIASIALAEYEALMRQPDQEPDWQHPPDPKPHPGGNE